MPARGAVQRTTSIFHFGREEDKQEKEEEENVWDDREKRNGREVIG